MGLQGLTLVIVLQLLHLQRHDVFVLDVSDVICRVPLGTGAPVSLVAPLVLLIVQRGESQNVEEQQGGPHGDGDAQFRGIIPLGFNEDGGVLGPRFVWVLGLLGVIGWGDSWALGGGPYLGRRSPGAVGKGCHVRRRDLGGRGDILEYLIQVVQVGDEFQPERHFCGSVVIPHSGFQADMQVQLVLWVILGPGHLLKAIGFCVNELGVLRNRLVGITGDRKEGQRERRSHWSTFHKGILKQEVTSTSSPISMDMHKIQM